jgi:hypothetical protein
MGRPNASSSHSSGSLPRQDREWIETSIREEDPSRIDPVRFTVWHPIHFSRFPSKSKAYDPLKSLPDNRDFAANMQWTNSSIEGGQADLWRPSQFYHKVNDLIASIKWSVTIMEVVVVLSQPPWIDDSIKPIKCDATTTIFATKINESTTIRSSQSNGDLFLNKMANQGGKIPITQLENIVVNIMMRLMILSSGPIKSRVQRRLFTLNFRLRQGNTD